MITPLSPLKWLSMAYKYGPPGGSSKKSWQPRKESQLLRKLPTVGDAFPLSLHLILNPKWDDDLDEKETDAVDAWVAAWKPRLQACLHLGSLRMDDVVRVEDSEGKRMAMEKADAETEFGQQVTGLQHCVAADILRVSRLESARAQAWDDWSIHNVMHGTGVPSPKRARTVATQVDDGHLYFGEECDHGMPSMPEAGVEPPGLGLRGRCVRWRS